MLLAALNNMNSKSELLTPEFKNLNLNLELQRLIMKVNSEPKITTLKNLKRESANSENPELLQAKVKEDLHHMVELQLQELKDFHPAFIQVKADKVDQEMLPLQPINLELEQPLEQPDIHLQLLTKLEDQEPEHKDINHQAIAEHLELEDSAHQELTEHLE